MPDALYRVSIHCAAADRAVAADLVLPAAMTVSQLLPSIVDAVGATADVPRNWYLAPAGGAPLDESMTLAQNDVRDGDVLILSGRVPVAPRSYGLIHALTVEAPQPAAPPALRTVGGLWACAVGMVAVLCADGVARMIVAAVLAAVITASACAAPRLALPDPVGVSLRILAVVSLAVLGFVAVPADPGPANVFLSAAAAASLGVVMVRTIGGPIEILYAVVAFAVVVAIVAGFAVLLGLAVQAFGAFLGALGMAALSLSARMSIAVAKLTPGEVSAADDVDALAARGHRVLFGLVAGSSAAAALGAVLVAIGARASVTFAAVAFDAAVGAALLLRGGSYASGWCRTMLSGTGFCALTAMFALVVAWAPAQGNWAGVLAVAGGLAVLGPGTVTSAALGRAADTVEYAALAAVAPLACWLAGVLDMVRGFGM
ncbi:type VII secretion integral membrane protein EccD [Mycolicibacterium goodii]